MPREAYARPRELCMGYASTCPERGTVHVSNVLSERPRQFGALLSRLYVSIKRRPRLSVALSCSSCAIDMLVGVWDRPRQHDVLLSFHNYDGKLTTDKLHDHHAILRQSSPACLKEASSLMCWFGYLSAWRTH